MTERRKQIFAAILLATYVILLYIAMEVSKGRVWKGPL